MCQNSISYENTFFKAKVLLVLLHEQAAALCSKDGDTNTSSSTCLRNKTQRKAQQRKCFITEACSGTQGQSGSTSEIINEEKTATRMFSHGNHCEAGGVCRACAVGECDVAAGVPCEKVSRGTLLAGMRCMRECSRIPTHKQFLMSLLFFFFFAKLLKKVCFPTVRKEVNKY
ncbi:hypothetical protein IscW_ISCW017472 [Ixodes scapularis]|uniref:Uncharacterized protein n=1 Tax=Ixodes scapularis TaxID=6945 RepID=B7P871_IXOSC|nr:hypothetical protein IscW_ISCW017472 [Ixodes scapularis]|eukprot:XP_002401564.1 hypothetical protein IscW_ISCW017472 [Ixodes scapularis]